ncbi:hypothetical protein Q1695_004746 [Nippostrongylus brasiliensis]|nr:hypothetical protein Q1695_004746 [Nippostrongylus brasiliensis]
MPVAARVAQKIFCAHGGISPFINKLEDINKIQRPSVVPAYGIACDLVWSDPSPQRNGWILSHRGISFLFGGEAVEEFCKKHDLDIIIRGHQINNDMYKNGYRVSFDGRLITIFSAPNYMNYKNNACVLSVTSSLELKFTVYRCRYYQSGKKKKPTEEANKDEKKDEKKDPDGSIEKAQISSSSEGHIPPEKLSEKDVQKSPAVTNPKTTSSPSQPRGKGGKEDGVKDDKSNSNSQEDSESSLGGDRGLKQTHQKTKSCQSEESVGENKRKSDKDDYDESLRGERERKPSRQERKSRKHGKSRSSGKKHRSGKGSSKEKTRRSFFQRKSRR